MTVERIEAPGCPNGTVWEHILGKVQCADPDCPFQGKPSPPFVPAPECLFWTHWDHIRGVALQCDRPNCPHKEKSMQPTATEVVRAALRSTDPEYLDRMYAMRAGESPERMGSYFPGVGPDGVRTLIESLEWAPYTHPAIEEPAQGFIASDVPGRMNMVHIDDLPEAADLEVSDPKNTPTKECEVVLRGSENKGRRVTHVTLLIGPSEGRTVVWTFFPGDPVKPSAIPRHGECLRCEGTGREMDGERGPCLACEGEKAVDRHGRIVSKSQAKRLGVEWVKLA